MANKANSANSHDLRVNSVPAAGAARGVRPARAPPRPLPQDLGRGALRGLLAGSIMTGAPGRVVACRPERWRFPRGQDRRRHRAFRDGTGKTTNQRREDTDGDDDRLVQDGACYPRSNVWSTVASHTLKGAVVHADGVEYRLREIHRHARSMGDVPTTPPWSVVDSTPSTAGDLRFAPSPPKHNSRRSRRQHAEHRQETRPIRQSHTCCSVGTLHEQRARC